MKLRKLNNGYYSLYDTDGDILASNNPDTPCSKRLSKQNCDEIFGVVNVDDLAYKHRRVYQDSFEGMNECIMKDAMHQQVGFVAGFNKAMELNKDKLFTIEDMNYIFQLGFSLNGRAISKSEYDAHIKSLQQLTEIEVEIDMWFHGTRHVKGKWIERLDENGCLILTKKK